MSNKRGAARALRAQRRKITNVMGGGRAAPASSLHTLSALALLLSLAGWSDKAAAACSPAATTGADVINCSGAGTGSGRAALEGDDVLNIDASAIGFTAGSYYGNEGNDATSITGAGTPGTTVLNYVKGGTGDDVITIDSSAVDIRIGLDGDYRNYAITSGDSSETNGPTQGVDGNDRIYLEAGKISSVNGGGGNDLIELSGADVHGSATNNNPVFVGHGLRGQIRGGAGQDAINLLGGSAGSVHGDGGNDTIMLDGAHITAQRLPGAALENAERQITGGSGDDTITLRSGSAGRVEGNEGDDLISLEGADVDVVMVDVDGTPTPTGTGAILGGAGADQIFLSAGRASSVGGDAGADRITLDGAAVGQVDAGDGDDTFQWRQGSLATGFLGGTGSDHAQVDAPGYDGSQVLDGGDDTGTADGWSDTLRLHDHDVATSGSRLLNWERIEVDGIRLTLDDADLRVGGDVDVDGLPINGLHLRNGAQLALGTALNLTGNLVLDSGTRLQAGTADGSGRYQVLANPLAVGGGALVNNGIIDLRGATPAAGDTLAVAGRYASDSGAMLMDTRLADDAAATDALILNGGGATGRTVLDIQNAGGAGALTTGNGIAVVDARSGAGTRAGAFVLAGSLAAGPYEYTLVRGSVDASAPDSWFLRSNLDCSAPGAAELDACKPAAPAPGPTPPSGPTPPLETPATGATPAAPVVPNYRREMSLYSALPQAATLYGRALLDTLHQRVGEQEQLHGRADLAQREHVNGAWGRLIGQSGEHDGGSDGLLGSRGPQFDYRTHAAQLGVDLLRREAQGKRDHAGVYGAVGRTTLDVEHLQIRPAGSASMDGYTIGGYWTRYGQDGWYLDGVAQATRFDIKADSSRPGYGIKTRGTAWAGSLEGGKAWRADNGVSIEPQAQIVYQRLRLNDARDRAALLQWDSTDSLAGRIGLRVAKTWEHAAATAGAPARQTTLWGRVNLWHEFNGDSTLRASSAQGPVPLAASLGGQWTELQLGVTAQLGRNTSLYGNVGAQWGLGGDDSHAYEGRVGVRVNW